MEQYSVINILKIKNNCRFFSKIVLLFLIPGFLFGDPPVTNPQRDDGFGAQFLTIMLAAMYAELYNRPFYYTPFIRMEHNYDNDPNFLQKKEELINVIGNFPINQDNQAEEIGVGTLCFLLGQGHYADAFARTHTLQKFKQIFRVNKNRSKYFDDAHFHIAVHVRRRNPHDCRDSPIPDRVYLEIIHKLRTQYSSHEPLFHIYSQGNFAEFEPIYGAHDVVFHLNESIEDTFTSMVFANALVTSASTFSYTAGFLSDGSVYYIRFDHLPLPLPNWFSAYKLLGLE